MIHFTLARAFVAGTLAAFSTTFYFSEVVGREAVKEQVSRSNYSVMHPTGQVEAEKAALQHLATYLATPHIVNLRTPRTD